MTASSSGEALVEQHVDLGIALDECLKVRDDRMQILLLTQGLLDNGLQPLDQGRLIGWEPLANPIGDGCSGVRFHVDGLRRRLATELHLVGAENR